MKGKGSKSASKHTGQQKTPGKRERGRDKDALESMLPPPDEAAPPAAPPPLPMRPDILLCTINFMSVLAAELSTSCWFPPSAVWPPVLLNSFLASAMAMPICNRDVCVVVSDASQRQSEKGGGTGHARPETASFHQHPRTSQTR